MDPDRVKAYLQVACAGLGFDIGEVWWSSNDSNSSALATIHEPHDEVNSTTITNGKRMRFVQLYTSRSYNNLRSQLVTPADEEDYIQQINNDGKEEPNERPNNGAVAKKHVLSPLLVDAISKTAQVVWAHTKKQEGLTGRSDLRLQTAVGMPVAIDGNGNMCVVVMFSPNNISSTDDALEYLQSISRSATSTSIPSLLPAFDPKLGLVSLPHHHSTNEIIPLLSQPNMRDGSVITRFVSLDDAPVGGGQLHVPEIHSNHDLVNAPKDCFGIPMLPSVTMLDGSDALAGAEVFDEASYGVWSTIMESGDQQVAGSELLEPHDPNVRLLPRSEMYGTQAEETNTPMYALNRPKMERERLDRLEEFAAAFLDVSVFDFAEVWVPIGEQAGCLGQVSSVVSTDSDSNSTVKDFEMISEKILIKFWSGAVGRAFSSGNPVWSANQDVFADSGRSNLFSQAKIESALAVPVFSGKATTPSFVFSCYSLVRCGSVPFVLKFVQQALRLLWEGLDKVQPHSSVGQSLWRDVAPADLGEMAADVEMQQHFMIKKRPHAAIETPVARPNVEEVDLASNFQAMSNPSGSQPVRSIYTGTFSAGDEFTDEDFEPNVVLPVRYLPIQTVQGHIQQVIQPIQIRPATHEHVATNDQGSKRAHVFIERIDSPVESDISSSFQQQERETPMNCNRIGVAMNAPVPLAMPRPLPLPNGSLRQPANVVRSPDIQPISIQQAGYSQQGTHIPSNSYEMQQQQSYVTPQNYQHYQSQAQQPPYQTQTQQLQRETQPQQQQYQTQPQQLQYQTQPQQTQYQALPLQPQYQAQPLQPQYQAQPQQPQYQAQQQQPLYQTQNQQPQHGDVSNNNIQYTTARRFSNEGQGSFGISPTPPHSQHQSNQAQQSHLPQASRGNISTSAGQSSMTYMQQQPPPQKFPGTQQVVQEQLMQAQPQQLHLYNQSNESLTLPTGYDPPTTATTATTTTYQFPDDRSASSTRPQTSRMNYQNHGNNKISATGIVFDTPIMIAQAIQQQASNVNGGGMDRGSSGAASPSRLGSSIQFCQVITTDGKLGTSNRLCRIQGCKEAAVFRRPYCTAHSGNRMCEHPGCPKCAQGSTRFCIAHGGGRRCTFPGCDKGARDKFFCAAHGGGKRCREDGCEKSAVGGSLYCTAHGGGRRCSVEGCDKSAQSSTRFCVKHGGGKKCAHEGCEKVARGRTQYCAAHGGGIRCKLAGCNRVAIGKVQLCRAHGGGTRPRKNNKGGDGASVSSALFGGGVNGDDDDDGDDDDGLPDQCIPVFEDMATI